MCQRSVFTIETGGLTIGFRRDKDIPKLVKRIPRALGIAGSDALVEAPMSIRVSVVARPVLRLAARFALASKIENIENVTAKMLEQRPIAVATSNPNQLVRTAEDLNFKIGEILCLGGAVEATLDDDPGLDAVFDIVSTGKTLQACGLGIIIDNAAPLDLVTVTAI